MHRVDGPGAASGNLFTEGNPVLGVDPTEVPATWLNSVQEEIAGVVETAGLTLSKADNGQLVAAIGLLNGLGGNLIINGDGSLSTRSGWLEDPIDEATGIEFGNVDRWAILADDPTGAGVSGGPSQAAFTPGQVDVPGAPPLYIFWDQAIAATQANPRMMQPIENVRRFSGVPVSYSLWVNSSIAGSYDFRIVQNFGTGGSAEVVVTSQTVALSASTWTRITGSATLPSVDGKTIGNDSHLKFEIEGRAGSTFSLGVAQVMVTLSKNPVEFIRRPPDLELALARRYFEKSNDVDAIGTSDPAVPRRYGPAVTDQEHLGELFRVPKRVTPAMLWWSPTSGDRDKVVQNGVELTVTTANNARSSAYTGFPTTSVSGAAGYGSGHWAADAEIRSTLL